MSGKDVQECHLLLMVKIGVNVAAVPQDLERKLC